MKIIPLDCDLTSINDCIPALSLPTEVACIIFKMASDSPPTFLHTTKHTPIDPRYVRTEVRISHVCRLWRSMALTYPELWSTFIHDDLWTSKIPLSCLAAYLQRSCNRLIDLYFRLGEKKREDWIDTLECIAEHVLRWRRLSLCISREWPAGYLFTFFEHLSPQNLEMLEIYTPLFNTHLYPHPIFKNGAPKLQNMRMDSRTFKICDPVTWNYLTVMNLQVEREANYHSLCPWSSFVNLLNSPHLKHLSLLGFIFYGPHPHELDKTTVASNLVNFRCSDDSVAIHMWKLVRAPRLKLLILKDLSLNNILLPPSSGSSIHDDLGVGVFPRLSTLVLINCNPGRSWFGVTNSIPFTKLTASVKRLVLVQFHGLGLMHTLLSPATDISTYWPRLESLIFYYHDIEREFKGEVRDNLTRKFAEMILRRSQNLKRSFKFGLHENQASRWKSKDSKSWTRFNKAGVILGPFTKEDKKEVIPWPALEHSQFDISSEEDFLLS